MKSRHRMLFACIILLVAISCVCNSSSLTPSASSPATSGPAATSAPAQGQTSTQAPAQNQQFFTEEFDGPLSSAWSTLTVTGSDTADASKVTVAPQNGKLVWDFKSKNVYYYLFYQGASPYTDVKVEVRADNRGVNNNNISLVCRYDPKVGWYEFNIANSGLYEILYAEVTASGKIGYSRITNGGSNNIKQGKDVNEYSITCAGQKLSLTINGIEVKTISEKKFALREGGVGVSVSAFDYLPVLIEMDWLKISQP
jgi:hypothetical protein